MNALGAAASSARYDAESQANARVQLQGAFLSKLAIPTRAIPDAGAQPDAGRPCLLQRIVRLQRHAELKRSVLLEKLELFRELFRV